MALLSAVSWQSAIAGASSPPRPPVANYYALQALSHVSELSPSALALAGMSEEAMPSLFTTIAAAQSGIATMCSARDEYSMAQAADSGIRAAIHSRGLSVDRAAASEAALMRLSTATAALRAAESDFRGVVISVLSDQLGADNAALAQRAASNLSRRVPDAWKLLDLPTDSPVWRTLESAWFKAQRGLPDSAFTQAERDALAAVQSDPTVALAQQRLDANLAGIEAAWAQFIAEQMAGEESPI